MAKAFGIAFDEEEVASTAKCVIGLEIVMWFIVVICAAAHLLSQATTTALLQEVNITDSVDVESNLRKERDLPKRGLSQGDGGSTSALLFGGLGVVGATLCVYVAYSGFKTFSASGSRKELGRLVMGNLCGTVFVLCACGAAAMTGTWYGTAADWTVEVNCANATSTEAQESDCRAALNDAQSWFDLASMLYYLLLIILVPLFCACIFAARRVDKVSHTLDMVAGSSMEFVRTGSEKARRSSVESPVLGPMVRRISARRGSTVSRNSVNSDASSLDCPAPAAAGAPQAEAAPPAGPTEEKTSQDQPAAADGETKAEQIGASASV